MQQIEGSSDSREISNAIKDSTRTAGVEEYGEDKLPCGDISGREIIVVEGRADVLNLLRNGVNNVIAMNGTKLPESIKKLGNEKEITLFVDGDRGGRLIAQNVIDNTRVRYIAFAPDGKEVEELTGKEIYINLRKKISVDEFLRKERYNNFSRGREITEKSRIELDDEKKSALKKISDENRNSEKAILLDSSFNEMKNISVKALNSTLKRMKDKPSMIVIDGAVSNSLIEIAEESQVQVIVAKNFSATSEKIKLLSL